MTQDKIDRINELARKSRTPEGLTDAEKAEQTALRNEFRADFKANLESQLKNIEIVDNIEEAEKIIEEDNKKAEEQAEAAKGEKKE